MKVDLDNHNFHFRSNSPESTFIKALFEKFDSWNVRYAVMRNYKALPQSVGDSDIDLIIATEAASRAKSALYEAVEDSNAVVIGTTESIGFFKCFAFGLNPESNYNWWGLRIDVNIGLQFRGCMTLLDTDAVLDRLSLHNGIPVLPQSLAAVLGVLKEILHAGILPARYHEEALSAADSEWDGVAVSIRPMGPSAVNFLKQIILDGSINGDLQRTARKLRQILYWKVFKENPGKAIKNRLYYEWSKMKRLMRPSGVVISVLGVDGVGKSTVITAIKTVLDMATHNAVITKHLRPGLLPSLGRLKGKQTQQDGPVLNPHGSKPSGNIASFIRLIYLVADYIIGYWVLIRPQIAKQPAVVLYDRYAYDIALDPRRFRIKLSQGLIRWFTKFAPKPDIIICLHASPEDIHARKQELPIEEVRRQIEALKKFAADEPSAVLVSTEGSIDAVTDRTLTILFEFFDQRNQSGYESMGRDSERLFAAKYLWPNEFNYIAVPRKKNCRWVIPSAPSFAKKAWDLYHPHSFMGNCAKKVFKIMASLGLMKVLKFNKIF